jgi:GNAT superfamily N-acetyltransferase
MTADISIVTEADVSREELGALFEEAFLPQKGKFLLEHGDWLYRGTKRLVVKCGDSVAGYHGIIPATCLINGREQSAIWGIDLYVALRFRGLGLQRVIMQRLLEMTELFLGFPNDMNAEICRRQREGRVRDDLKRFILPLYPRSLEAVQGTAGFGGVARYMGGLSLSPLAAVYRSRAVRYRPKHTAIVDYPDPEVLERVFSKYAGPGFATTIRDKGFLTWRYIEAPYRSDLVFYLAGGDKPTLYSIVRYLTSDGSTRARILDMFGDFGNDVYVDDMLRTIARDATIRGATQVTTVASLPRIAPAMRRAGFLRRRGALYFTWTARNPAVQDWLSSGPLYWTLGDSDLDGPG